MKESPSQEILKDLHGRLDHIQDAINFIIEHSSTIDTLGLPCTFHQVGIAGLASLDYDRLKHDDVVKVMLAFPGHWSKIQNSIEDRAAIDYTLNLPKFKVRCWAGEPPPSCRVIQEEVLVPEQYIPAHTEVVTRLECK